VDKKDAMVLSHEKIKIVSLKIDDPVNIKKSECEYGRSKEHLFKY